jgi:uncharacterized repeat protein (TIGR02543 family)
MRRDLRWNRKVVKSVVFSLFLATFSSMATLPAQASTPTIANTYGLSTYSHRSWVTSSDTTTVMFGTNLSNVTSVTVGGSAVAFETTTAGTSIRLTVPAGAAGPKDVVITNASGSTTLTGGFAHYTTLTPACGTSGTFTIVNNAVTGHTSCTGTVTVPEGVTRIASFYGAAISGIVTLPSTLLVISDQAFYGTGQISVVIPKSVTSMDGAFWTSGITSLTFETPTSLTSIGASTIRTTANITSLVIPEGIRTIGNIAIATTGKLRKISLPSTITSISSTAFQDAGLTCVANPGNNAVVNAATYSPQPVNFPASGNAFASTAPRIVSDFADCADNPTITSISSTSGQTTGGTSLVITGTNLTGTRGVKIGTFNATIETVTSTSVAIKTAAGTGTTLPIHLVSGSGWLTTASPIVYSYNPPPTVSSLNVTSGITAGGTITTITGTNLLNVSSVTVGGVSATLGANSQTTQAITTPSTTVGAKDIVITTPSGTVTATGAFTYYTTLTPACGTSGTFTISNNIVTGHTSCTGTVTIPEGVTAIASAGMNGIGFRGAPISGIVTLPSTLKTIGSYAFRDTGAISVVIPRGFTTFSGELHFQFSGITSVTFETPTSLTQLPKGVFSSALPSLIVPQGITSLGDSFVGASLRNLSLPGSITSISATALTAGGLVCVANPGDNAMVSTLVSTLPQVPPADWPGVGNAFSRVPVKLVSNFADCPSGNPTITSISASSGTTAGGTSVVISGTNLTGTRGVKIGTFDATIETVTATSVAIRTPAGTGSSLQIHLVAEGGWVSSAAGIRYSYALPPTFSSLSVTAGPAAGGTSTVISGANLTGATSVTVGGTAATLGSNTGTSLTITTPSGTSGLKDVVITTPSGSVTAANAYRYAGIPTFTSLSVTAGPLAGGTTTVITGTNLESATAVTVGGAAATRGANTSTSLTITTPSRTVGAKDIVITTAGGSVTATAAFTYVTAPTISSLSVTTGSTAGGTVSVISGTNMSNTTAVTVGGIPATFETNTATSITITTAASVTDGAKNVVLTTAGGSSTLSNSFNYKFPITYNGNTNTGGSVPTSILRNTNETVTASANSGSLLKSGYTFGGWNRLADGTGTNYSAGVDSFTVTGSTILYAKWTINNYTVTYRADSATAGIVPVDAANYNIGNSVVIRANTGSLVRTGYEFDGWTVAADGSGTVLKSGVSVTTGVANMTFYAKWSPLTYTITYNSNGANSGSPQRATDTYTTAGTAVTLSGAGTLAKDGFDFAGWSTSPTGDVIVGTYTTTSNVTLHAVWTIKSIAISFAKGAASAFNFTNFPTGRSANFGSTITLNDAVDSAATIGGSSYAFVGWRFSDNDYKSGSPYLLTATPPTFTAQWAKLFAVRYVLNGGTAAVGSSTVDAECLQADNTCLDAQIITSNAAPTRAGYQFAGWADQNGTTVPTADSFTVSSSRYLIYANWTPINYSITYQANGGSTVDSSFTKRLGETFTVGSALSRSGYDFTFWSDGSSTIGAGATYYITIPGAVVLTAQWSPKTYTIAYDWNGGTGSATNSDTFTVGTTPVTLPLVGDHVKDGFQFNGWSTAPDGTLISGGYAPTSNVKLFAIWGSGSYVVTFDAAGGSVSPATATVPNGSAVSLPTPTRTSYHFDGWFNESTTPATKITGSTFIPTSSRTITARWTQNSLYGVGAYTDFGSIVVSNGIGGSFSANNATSSVSVSYPMNALPAGTVLRGFLLTDPTSASGLIPVTHNPVLGMVIAWQAPDGTVPSTDTGTAISVTMTNDSIKTGARIFNIVGGVSTYIGTATSDGTITVNITDDPLLVVVTTKPDEPTSVVAVGGQDAQSTVSWTEPVASGGSPIIGYTVLSSRGQTCASVTTTCVVTSLTNGSTYTFTVTASNALGASVQSVASASITVGTTPSGGGGVNPPVEQSAPVAQSAPITVPKVVKPSETATAQAELSLKLKVARETLQLNVAQNQKSYVELFASLTSSDSSAPTLIPNQKSGASINTKIEMINSAQSANLKVSAKNISLSSAVLEELKSRARITVTATGISVTPVGGFTGVLVVPVVGIVDGVETVVLNKVVVNPAPPIAQSFTPTSINQSSIAWAPSTSQTTGYLVLVNGKKICQTTANVCPIAELIGPKSLVTITALGNDQTVSVPVVIPYAAKSPIPALRVNFAVGSSNLSAAQKSEIRAISRIIDTQGFTRLVVNGFTDSSGSLSLNKKLSEDRAKSVATFVRTLLPKIAIKASAFGPKKPLASNASLSGKAQNRRTEIATW